MTKKKLIDLRTYLNLTRDTYLRSVEDLAAFLPQKEYTQPIYVKFKNGELVNWLKNRNGANRPDLAEQITTLSAKELNAKQAVNEMSLLLEKSGVSVDEAPAEAVKQEPQKQTVQEKPAAPGAVTPPLSFLISWGGKGKQKGKFDEPTGIAVSQLGFIFVADTQNDRIQKYDLNGKFFAEWGTQGTANTQFRFPTGMAVDSKGFVYAAEQLNHRVQKFDGNGTFVTAWGQKGTRKGKFTFPYGVAVDPQGDVYVVDKGNNRIQKFTSLGLLAKWKTQKLLREGRKITMIQLNRPTDIIVDSQGFLYVADTGNNRIMKFDKDGKFVTQWGKFGSGVGEFSSPEGICLDPQSFVYVADTDNHRIQIFDSNGQFFAQFGKEGTGKGEFNGPVDVATDSDGFIYVVDRGNDRAQKFQKR